MPEETLVVVEEVRFYVRNVRTRMPFRYGKASLVAAPVLHVKMKVRDEKGGRAEGYSADCLPPKWFDKSPEKDFRRNVEDLLTAARTGARCYLEAGSEPASLFEIWRQGYRQTVAGSGRKGLNSLTGSFGSSLMERALIDGICKLAGLDFHTCLRENRFGLDPGAVHPELADRRIDDAFAADPMNGVFVRHTVGLADPIRTFEIAPDELLNDGLPQSLETWVEEFGIRYFKVKVNGRTDEDVERLSRIAELLREKAPEDYGVSIDGNESFSNIEALVRWVDTIRGVSVLQDFLDRVLYFEQPLERSEAFHPEVEKCLAGLPIAPVIIDESDDALSTFKTAVELGYRGVSVKNCKGVLKGILNRMLVDFYNEKEAPSFLLTGEDLMNVPVVPLQQDLATMCALGLSHVERNGHHYCRGLDHLTERERRQCLENHSTLYETYSGGERLKIRDGRIETTTVFSEGYGGCGKPDFEAMTPLDDWGFESLETKTG